MKPDGPTMTDLEIARWEAQFTAKAVAVAAHKARYKGGGNPMTIRGERKHHPKPEPVQGVMCVHRYRIPEPDGSVMLVGVCGYCGATRAYRVAHDEEPTPMRGRKL